MTKEEWLNKIIAFDEWGRPPGLADVPLMPVHLYVKRLTNKTIKGVQND